jgi:mRNA interferase RelE/StbE
MKYQIRFVVSAQTELRRLPCATAMTILRTLAELESDPLGFDTTALTGDPGVRRLRVGDYRIAYEIYGNELVVLVVKVGHRSVVYRSP